MKDLRASGVWQWTFVTVFRQTRNGNFLTKDLYHYTYLQPNWDLCHQGPSVWLSADRVYWFCWWSSHQTLSSSSWKHPESESETKTLVIVMNIAGWKKNKLENNFTRQSSCGSPLATDIGKHTARPVDSRFYSKGTQPPPKKTFQPLRVGWVLQGDLWCCQSCLIFAVTSFSSGHACGAALNHGDDNNFQHSLPFQRMFLSNEITTSTVVIQHVHLVNTRAMVQPSCQSKRGSRLIPGPLKWSDVFRRLLRDGHPRPLRNSMKLLLTSLYCLEGLLN